MRTTIDRSALSDILTTIAPAVAGRSTLPSLSCVRIDADNGTLTAAATNLEIRITAVTECEVHESGSALVPYKLLADLVRSVPAPTLELTNRDNKVRVTGESVNALISGLPVDEFPDAEAGEYDATFDLPADAFAEAIQAVRYAVSTDQSRPTLAGVNMVAAGGVLTLAATDGFRLATTELDIDPGMAFDVIVPAAVLAAVRASADNGDTVHCALGEKRARFACGNVTHTGQLIDAKYPDYKAIIPKSSSVRIKAPRKQLLSAIGTAQLFADSALIIRLALKESTLAVCARSDTGESNLDIEVEGEGEIEIAVNARYLDQTLAALTGNTVTLEMTQPTRPIKATASGRPMAVVMPMHPPR